MGFERWSESGVYLLICCAENRLYIKPFRNGGLFYAVLKTKNNVLC
jgi:hypothetical protein